LHATDDPLDLRSSVAYVMNSDSGKVMFEKNADVVLPIASISKLMTSMVVIDAQQDLHQVLEITKDDIDSEKGTHSRLRVGTRLSRAELLHLALMSSENRAASALGRNYPGGLQAFVSAMNAKSRMLGMADTRFVEPTGLSSRNVSTARDLARMVQAAGDYPLIRQYSTSPGLHVGSGKSTLAYRNTNRLTHNPKWDIELQKTGYISEAGNCLVMQVRIEGKAMVMVLLDAKQKLARFADAQRLRHWIELKYS
jgi:D-alanyl-D-alanine endopeptidase (penicillin-binding protein 7)